MEGKTSTLSIITSRSEIIAYISPMTLLKDKGWVCAFQRNGIGVVAWD